MIIEQILGWIGNCLFFYGVYALAKKSIFGFYANALANVLYIVRSFLIQDEPLFALSLGLLIINIYGIKKWLK
jgi:hypothetical protein